MKTDQYGRIVLTTNDMFNYLFESDTPEYDKIYLDSKEEAEKFNRIKRRNGDQLPDIATAPLIDIDVAEFDKLNQRNWFMPEEYKIMDIEGYLINVCPKQNYQRVIDELHLYKKYNMIDLLRYLKYLVDTMRSNKVVWGVGRGSSVASYVLFLIGIHKIDSIKYKLDIHEFLK